MKNFILSMLMLLGVSGLAAADAITFEASINSPRVALNEALQLTLTFTGINQDLDPINLPSIDGFSTKYLGPSTSVSIVNGNYHSERSFIYNLFPNRIGKFQIPAITATLGGQAYTTKPIDVEVFESSTQAQASAGTSGQNQVPNAESLKDKILIMVSVGKTDVYLNERIPLTIKLLVNDVPIRDIQFPQFDKKGMVVDDFEKPIQSAELVNGVRYDTVEFKANVYPDQLGDLTLGPIQIQGNVLYKTGQNNPFSQENNFFGSDVFNNFFDSYATRPVMVTSKTIQLHVLHLPSENRPEDFNGAIGESFDFQASVSPLQVKAGDPLTLKMDIKGKGNFKSFKMPIFKAPDFKSYEPQIKDTGEEKTAEQVIVPTSANVKEVPALHFSYFDTSIKDYKTITQGPFAIQVAAPSPDQEFKAVGFADVSRESSLPVANPFSFRKTLSHAHQVILKLFRSIWFWTGLGFMLAAGLSFFLWRRLQDRLKNDPAFARKLKAVREARQALVAAEDLMAKGRPKDFYALLTKVLHDYLANKWHQSSAALSSEEILKHLKTVKLDEFLISQIKNILEQSDLVCFAGAAADTNKMSIDLSQTRDVIARLEKILK